VFDDMKRFRPQEAQPVDAARLGEELRDARLALGLSVEDVAAELRIRRVYLIALEEGRVKDLPSPAYAVGFVRNYAGALGLDPAEMVRRLRDAVATGVRKTDLVFPEPVPERGFPAGVLVLAGAVVAIGAYVAWYNWAGSGNRSVDAVPPVPARLEPAARTGEALRPATPAPVAPANGTAPAPAPNVVAAAPSPTTVIVPALPVPTPVPVQVPTPAAPPAAAAPPADQSRITLRAKAEIWTQVRDTRANQTLISRNLRPGETFVVPNREGLLLSVGNAALVEVLVDGQLSPNFGNTPGVRRDVPLVADQLRPRPATGAPPAATPAGQRPATPAPAAAAPPQPAAQPPAPARLNPPAASPTPPRQ
jgi:cytoskeleton protein RodZ